MASTESTSVGKTFNRLYRTFVSVKTTLFFLAVFAILFFVGTVFPQSADPDRLEQYRDAGGKLVALVGILDLLNLFHSWYFLVFAGLFALHLVLCSIHRLNVIRRRVKYGLFSREDILQRELSFSFSLEDDGQDIEQILKSLGFGRIKYYSENAQVKRLVAEKGIPFRWLSWTYHLFIFVVMIGFCISSLFAFEDYLSLAEREKKIVKRDSSGTGWGRLAQTFGWSPGGSSHTMEIELKDFNTAYIEKARLDYPKGMAERFFSAWSAGAGRPHYELPTDSPVARDWFSDVVLSLDGKDVKQKKIEVNDPLRHAGTTFYQIGYEHAFDLHVGEETLTGLIAEQPFAIPQMEGQFLLETPRAGLVENYGGGSRELSISAKLKYRPPAPPDDRKWVEVGALVPGVQAEVMRTRMTLSNVKESSILSYRYDPGVPLLWIGTTLLLVFMTLRIYLPWYQLYVHADARGERTLMTVGMRMVGIIANPERLKSKIQTAFRK